MVTLNLNERGAETLRNELTKHIKALSEAAALAKAADDDPIFSRIEMMTRVVNEIDRQARELTGF